MHIHATVATPLFQVKLEKVVNLLRCQDALQNVGVSKHKLKSVQNLQWSQCMPAPDRQTDEHQGNSATIRSNECIAC